MGVPFTDESGTLVPPTLASVAQRAGVSRQTVSNALNNPELLRSDTLERVLAVVAQASTLSQARADAYAGVADLDAPSLFCRSDIAERAEQGDIEVSKTYQVNSSYAQYVADVAEGDAGEW